VVNNVLAVPVFAFFLPSAFAHLLLHRTPLAPVSEILVRTAGSALTWVLEAMESWNVVIHAPHPAPATVAIYCALVLCLFLFLPHSRLRFFVLMGPPLLFLWTTRPADLDGNLRLTLLDVGQAESIHLAYPDGSHGLIDTGGAPFRESNRFLAHRVVARYLRTERVPALDFVLISHPDADHLGAYWELDRVFPLRRVLFFEPRADYRPPIDRIHSGMRFTLGGVKHRVIHPNPGDGHLDSNDQSLVVELRYGRFSALFTGEVGTRVEQSIRPRLNPVDVLKVGHHGSRTSTSSDLLLAVRPRVALISAGRRNAFGHPHPLVLSRLDEFGVPTYSTADWGTLRIRTDGETWSLSRYCVEARKFVPVTEGYAGSHRRLSRNPAPSARPRSQETHEQAEGPGVRTIG
jgi:competence protein ComEC